MVKQPNLKNISRKEVLFGDNECWATWHEPYVNFKLVFADANGLECPETRVEQEK